MKRVFVVPVVWSIAAVPGLENCAAPAPTPFSNSAKLKKFTI
jgi:hypothetical protein